MISARHLILKATERLIMVNVVTICKNMIMIYVAYRQLTLIHTLFFKLLQAWETALDKSGSVGTFLIDLPRVYDSLPHDIFAAKSLWHC